MERTESLVVQVAPSYENAKIQEMEQFGWILQGRQEIHQEGDAEGAPSIMGDSYVIRTKVSHYVKLHLVRPLSAQNLDRIRAIENEYFGLPFPGGPSLSWPLGLTVFCLLGVFIGSPEDPIAARLFFVMLTALCGYWVYKRWNKREHARLTCEASQARRKELVDQLSTL